MTESEFQQITDELKSLHIDELLAIQQLKDAKAIVITLKWGSDGRTMWHIEHSIYSWSFADETLIYFTFQD